MFCFSKTCRICKRSTNSVTLACNSQNEVKNLFFIMFPELMNSNLNHFMKNFCESCVQQLKLFEKFKNHCIESDGCYMQYLNQLEGHDFMQAEHVWELGIKQEDCQNDDSQIQPTFDNYSTQEASSYYGSVAYSNSTTEDIKNDLIGCDISISDIKEENEGATVEEAISVLDSKEFAVEEYQDTSKLTDQDIKIESVYIKPEISMPDIKGENEGTKVEEAIPVLDFQENKNTSMLTNQELFTSDYHRSIDEENVNENEIDCIQETVGGINNFHLKVLDSSVNTKTENDNIKTEYFQGKDDLSSLAEDDINKIDIEKNEIYIGDKDGSCNSFDSYVNNDESQEIAGKNHQPNNTNLKPYHCDLCGKSFALKNTMLHHKRTHTGEKPYQCNFCEKRFSIKSTLIMHTRTHTGEKPYQCDVCEKSFSVKTTLIMHKRIHTGEKPYQCDICQKSFSGQKTLINHTRTHTGEKPYECDICKKRFSQKPMLNNHRTTHTGEKPFECDVCKKSFSRKDSLMNHKRTHTGEKPYECDICKKCFAENSAWTKHKRIHTGEKPYRCDFCQRSFSEKSSLTIHRRTHTGEKPYPCKLCEKSFTDSGTLTKHIRTHTGEKPYQCDLCNKSFCSNQKVNAHKKAYCFSQNQSLIEERRCDGGT